MPCRRSPAVPAGCLLGLRHHHHHLLTRTGRLDLGRLDLPRGKRLTGRVLGPGGRPLAGVSVWSTDPSDPGLEWKGDDDPRLDPSAVTAPDGTFTIPRLSSQQPVVLCRSGYQRQDLSFPLSVSEPSPILLTPERTPSRASGRVLDEDGRPIQGARIRPVSGEGVFFHRWSLCETEDWNGAVTDAVGRFSLDLPASPTSRSSGPRRRAICAIKDYNRNRIIRKTVELSSNQAVTIDLLNP